MKLCLVVDDSQVVRKVAKCLLNNLGYDVHVAGDGQEALEICQNRMPDVILLDWHMPIMDGHEFLALFGRAFGSKQTHIVYATTDLDPTDISKAISAGANDYILKPYDESSFDAKFGKLPVVA
ncbi:MAG: response regulator [Pseudomonadota bacterium]